MTEPVGVVVHPLVLLSNVDHYNRVAKDTTKKRVVGCLLGASWKGKVDITNSFAVPFEEDDRDPSVWYLDHNFLENMFAMFKKVNAKEGIVGWYSTGPKIQPADLEIHELFRKYLKHPVFVIIDVNPKDHGIPTDAYVSMEIEEFRNDGSQQTREFRHLPSEMGAMEAEEVGVEHLLRDIKDTTASTLSQRVSDKLSSLKGLDSRLKLIKEYLELVLEGKLPVNHDIIFQLQDTFNCLPNLSVEELVRAFAVKTNDQMVVIYISSLIRSVIALHDLIANKVTNKHNELGHPPEKKDEASKEAAAATTEKGKKAEAKKD